MRVQSVVRAQRQPSMVFENQAVRSCMQDWSRPWAMSYSWYSRSMPVG